MQAIGQIAVPGPAPQPVAKPDEVHAAALPLARPVEIRAPALPRAEPLLFEEVTRRRSHEGTALGALIVLYGALLAAGVWMAFEVDRGLATAASCDGRCVEATR